MPVKILQITRSNRANKRYMITTNEDNKIETYHFGLEGGSTYLDHKDKAKREAYRKRHYANETEKQLIDNLTPSASVFSFFLLWGDKTDLSQNVADLQKKFNKKFQ